MLARVYIEKKIRELESACGSVVGATGALYAVRRRLLVPVPPETILDDVYLPMQVVRQGARVIFEPRARACETNRSGALDEGDGGLSLERRDLIGHRGLRQGELARRARERPLVGHGAEREHPARIHSYRLSKCEKHHLRL